jgi:hypothetical protein
MFLYKYDLSKGLCKYFGFLGLNGIWHTSVQAVGIEFYFGRNVEVLSQPV